MKNNRLLLHLAAFAISAYLMSCSFESVRTDNSNGSSGATNVDTLGRDQLKSPKAADTGVKMEAPAPADNTGNANGNTNAGQSSNSTNSNSNNNNDNRTDKR